MTNTENIEFAHSAIFANVAERKLRTLLLPWGELSRQSPTTKPIRFGRSRVKVPTDISIVGANVGHDHFAPVGRASEITDTDKGIVAVFSIAATDEGDKLLADAEAAWKAGTPLKVSPELRNIIRDGEEGISAELIGAGFVPDGAFQSAGVFSFATALPVSPAESDADKIARLELELLATHPTTTPGTAPAAPATPASPAPIAKDTPMGLPNTLGDKLGTPTTPNPVTKREAFAIFEAIRCGEATDEMLARINPTLSKGQNGVFALNDVKYDGSGSVTPDERRSQWLDQLWDGRTYEQQVIPLLSHKDLTAKKVAGFRWTTKPSGGDWSGNKSNIPSNQPATAAANATAEFWAMGHDHAIEHQIFDTPGYFESYFEMGTEDYALWADTKVLTDLIAGATTSEADDPTGLTIGAGFSALIDGAAEVITNGHALPTFALVETSLWKSMMKIPANAVLGYLDAALGLEKGTLDNSGFVIRPNSDLDAGNILVGARQAATVYELPGLIRVTAPDTVKGGIDTNMVGAAATLVHKATALQLVTPYTA
jgi:hypothetical protein